MTRKLLFGMLMALVLAFSVQSVCDALTLTATSDTTQTKQPTDASFEIQFSVGLNSNTTIAYNDENPRKRVTDANPDADGNPTAMRIDSSGYLVTDILGREYRDSAAATALGGDLVVGPRPQYPTDTNGAPLPASQLSRTPTATRYVDTGRNVVDADGEAVYIRTATGVRYSDSDTPADRSDDRLADPYKYERAKADPDSSVDVADRFDYNEEAIRVTSTNPDDIEISVKGSNYFLNPAGSNLTEVSGVLQRSMTLVCASTTAGTYIITIVDATEAKDFPPNAVPLEIIDAEGEGVGVLKEYSHFM